MKSNDFAKVLRTIIRKELKGIVQEAVDEAVAREFKLLREELAKPTKTTPTQKRPAQSVQRSFADMMMDEEEAPQKEVITENKKYFKNSPFANILNQTAPFSGREDTSDATQQKVRLAMRQQMAGKLGYGNKDEIKMTTADVPGYEQEVSLPTQDPDGRPINVDALNTETGMKVLQNLTRNYSDVVKAAEKKTKQRQGKI